MFPLIVLVLRIFMVIILFSFLGWAIHTLWRDLRFHSQILSQRKTPPITIIMESDPQPIKNSFTQNEIIVGREDSCDINLSDPIISGRHARLTFHNMHWWIEDLISTNGTFLNDERLESPAILISGDELRIGKNILLVEIPSTN